MRKGLCIGGSNQGNQTTLVALIVQQHRFLFTFLGKLATLIGIGHRNLKSDFGRIDTGTIEGNASLHKRSQHGEETATWAFDG